MDVDLTNTYTVSETIEAYFGDYIYGASTKFYRYIPYNLTVTRNIDGVYKDYVYGVDVNVTGLDIAETDNFSYDIYNENDNVVIEFSEDVPFNNHTRTYTINYTYSVGYDRIETHDDMYFNLIGTGWDTNIENFTFTVNMPSDFSSNPYLAEEQTNAPVFYYGAYGSTNTTVPFNINVVGNTITGVSTDIIEPFHAFTLSLVLQNDYFSQVTKFNIGFDQFLLVSVILSAVAVLIIYFKKRSTKPVVQTVEFYPPNDSDPVKLAYTLNGRISTHNLTSLYVYFASKGYLKIIDDQSNITLQKLKDLPEKAPEYQKLIFNQTFKSGSKVKSDKLDNTLDKIMNLLDKNPELLKDQQNAEQVKDLITNPKDQNSVTLKSLETTMGTTIFEALAISKTEMGPRLLSSTKKASVFMLFISLIPIFMFIAMYFTRIHTTAYVEWIFFAGILLLGAGVLSYFYVSSVFLPIKQRMIAASIFGLLLFAGAVLCVAFNFNETIVDKLFARYTVFIPLAISFVLFAKVLAFNEEYRELYGRSLGFRKNILLVEKNRMALLLNENPSYFYDILPYAYVMGITNEFIKKFEGIHMDTPNWYVYKGSDVFTILMFNRLMVNSFSGFTNRAISIASRKGASGYGGKFGGGGFGGGFSGGGFGGGGGGRG